MYASGMTPAQRARRVKALAQLSLIKARRRELREREKRDEAKLGERDFPNVDDCGHRKAVCKRCHIVMRDCEPGQWEGEFHHHEPPGNARARRCVNAGQEFSTGSREVVPFLRKRRRRALARLGFRP